MGAGESITVADQIASQDSLTNLAGMRSRAENAQKEDIITIEGKIEGKEGDLEIKYKGAVRVVKGGDQPQIDIRLDSPDNSEETLTVELWSLNKDHGRMGGSSKPGEVVYSISAPNSARVGGTLMLTSLEVNKQESKE